jgi:hypothetical protein
MVAGGISDVDPDHALNRLLMAGYGPLSFLVHLA